MADKKNSPAAGAGGRGQKKENNLHKQYKPLIDALSNAGASFCFIHPPGKQIGKRVSTGKEPVGAEWQKNPRSREQALAWLRQGGNVGVLCGYGGIVILDADADADAVEAALPQLRETIKITRANAPERAKWIVCVRGEMPRAQKTKKLEILAVGNQGVVAGVHASGAMLEWSGSAVVELDAEDLLAAFEQLTGAAAKRNATQQDGEPATAEQYADRLAYVGRVLAHANISHSAWKEKPDGFVVELEHCPFVERTDEPNRPHEAAYKAFVRVDRDGRIGAGCHAARCQHAIEQSGLGGWALLKEIVGWKSLPSERVLRVAARLREWVATADLAEFVPVVKQSTVGYRTRESDAAAILACLNIMQEQSKLENVTVSLRRLRHLAGFGSINTARAALDRLTPWFLRRVEARDEDGEPFVAYSLHPDFVALAEEMEEMNAQETGVYYEKYTPFLHYLNHDVFTCSLSEITPEELERKIEERKREIAEGKDVRPIQRWRYARRLNAAAPGAGRLALRIIDALEAAGGGLSVKELTRRVNASPATMRKTLEKLHTKLCLIVREKRRVSLLSTWQESVKNIAPLTPGWGRRDAKLIRDIDDRIRWLQRMLKTPSIGKGKRKRYERQLRNASRRKAEAWGIDPDAPAATMVAPDRWYFVTLRRLENMRMEAKIERREEQHLQRLTLRRQLRELKAENVPKREAVRMLSLAGWSLNEVHAEANFVYG